MVLETAKLIAMYKVKKGDTLSGIAARFYGQANAGKWKLIYNANKSVIGSDPDLIHPGQVLQIPKLEEEEGEFITQHTVVSGDTLSGIAAHYYGQAKAKKWRIIYNANKSVIGSNPNLIHPGQVLNIPKL